MSPEFHFDRGGSLFKRAVIACVLIVLLSAATAGAAGLLLIGDITDEITRIREKEGRKDIVVPEITRADAGDPRTIMILGSDRRYGDHKAGIKPRSDTIILVRLDSDRELVSLMSLPRDLKVEIPGIGTRKINYAYEVGGARKTVQTVTKLFEDASGEPFPINHVIEVNFSGFRRAVDYIGCAYIDIDRRYFNDNSGGENYATIDIEPGYQKICGQDALDYVRYRHNDTDFVRAARQQDFIRQLKSQSGVRKLLDLGNAREVVRLFARYTDSDKDLLKTKELLSLLKLVAFSASKPVREVRFRTLEIDDLVNQFVQASPDQLKKTLTDFYEGTQHKGPKEGKLRSTAAERKAARKRKSKSKNKSADVPGLEIAKLEGENQALIPSTKFKKALPVYFPRLRSNGGQYYGDSARMYRIRDEDGKLHKAYRMTVKKGLIGEYYGIQGTTWKDPPILDDPTETRVDRVSGRKLELFYDGRNLRLVAWRTPTAVYWVHNTLLQSLSNRQMIAIAASLQRVGQ